MLIKVNGIVGFICTMDILLIVSLCFLFNTHWLVFQLYFHSIEYGGSPEHLPLTRRGDIDYVLDSFRDISSFSLYYHITNDNF